VYTPTFRRPRQLAICEASVESQSLTVQHLIVRDEVGIGIDGMYAAVAGHVGEVEGEYVLILNDDNVFADDEFVADLEDEVDFADEPQVVVYRIDHVGRELPDEEHWGREPECGFIDCANFAVRRDVWVRHAGDWGRRYEGDFDFIHRLWREKYSFHWWDRLGVVVPQVGRGRPEE